MTNPLLERSRPIGGPMVPGDVRTFTARDPKTGEVTKEITIRRTNREYAYDLCDAYNEARPHGAMEYFVFNGEVKLGFPSNGQRPRAEYKPTDADLDAIRAYVARAVASPVTQEKFNEHVRRTGGCPRG